MYSVYRLLDPRDMQIRYVGISKNVQQRFYEHCHTNGDNTHKDSWIQELKEISFTPILEVLATGLTCKEAQDQERQLIYHYYHKMGFPLTNKDGVTGNGGNRGMGGWRKKKYSVLIPKPPMGVQIVKANPEELLIPKDITKALQISEYKVKAMLRKGTIKGVKVDGQWRVRPADYQRYLDSLSQEQQDKK